MRVERARYFLAAVEAGSLRGAATRCGISQPALGQQIDLLEEELDVVLLTRGRLGVRPTQAGQDLLKPMARLVAAQDSLRWAAAESGGAYRGRVAIGAVPALAEMVIANVVGRLRVRHPDLRFTVTETSSAAIEAAVSAGDLDLGIATMPSTPPDTSIKRTVLFQAPIGAVVPLDHLLADRDSIRWSDLETWPIVTMREGTVMWERLQADISNPQVVVQAMSARSVKLMIAQGAGIGILTSFDTSSDVPGLRWIRLRDTPSVQICLVQRRDTQPSPSALTVRRLITERAAELLESAVSDR
ncbi:LysR family transcriptional regulator [Aeromicrobium sp. CTD01-1L150]|uniref:LysR family transcriptional regulator n=1 Tax=Aeromicrobium sp. CTD01-1L150 TaxID=3341830 RepID=UPI0035C10FF0